MPEEQHPSNGVQKLWEQTVPSAVESEPKCTRPTANSKSAVISFGPMPNEKRQSVLGPLLFNVLFDGISAAVRAACRSASLGRSPRALQVTLLLYANDVVVLAE